MQRRKKATNKTLFNQANEDADDDEEEVYDDNLHLEKNSSICVLNYVRGGILVQMAY